MLKRIHKAISIAILAAFICTSVKSPALAQVDPMPFMPKPGVMVSLSPELTPAYLKGIVIHPENALKFDFIIYKGDKPLSESQKKEEYAKLTKYFLASLAIPDDDQWVNLSPYEKDRIIKDDFGKTEMGRDLLAQDYLLKQITASLIYPEDNLGKKFWDKVYAQAQKQYGTTNIPVNTFNKVWILPDNALIYEKGNTAYVLKNHLRVMLEEDYLSLQKHSGIQSDPANKTHTIASKIVKEIVLPELQREVNEDANFAPLRQVYSGMLLAAWYKRALKESLLSKIYANKSMVKGVDQDPRTNEAIYQQYLKAYKKGVFNFIKEDVDKYTNEKMPRKYFSGGTRGFDSAMYVQAVHITSNPAQLAGQSLSKLDMATVVTNVIGAAQKAWTSSDAAMKVNFRPIFSREQQKLLLTPLDNVIWGWRQASEIPVPAQPNLFLRKLLWPKSDDDFRQRSGQYLLLHYWLEGPLKSSRRAVGIAVLDQQALFLTYLHKESIFIRPAESAVGPVSKKTSLKAFYNELNESNRRNYLGNDERFDFLIKFGRIIGKLMMQGVNTIGDLETLSKEDLLSEPFGLTSDEFEYLQKIMKVLGPKGFAFMGEVSSEDLEHVAMLRRIMQVGKSYRVYIKQGFEARAEALLTLPNVPLEEDDRTSRGYFEVPNLKAIIPTGGQIRFDFIDTYRGHPNEIFQLMDIGLIDIEMIKEYDPETDMPSDAAMTESEYANARVKVEGLFEKSPFQYSTTIRQGTWLEVTFKSPVEKDQIEALDNFLNDMQFPKSNTGKAPLISAYTKISIVLNAGGTKVRAVKVDLKVNKTAPSDDNIKDLENKLRKMIIEKPLTAYDYFSQRAPERLHEALVVIWQYLNKIPDENKIVKPGEQKGSLWNDEDLTAYLKGLGLIFHQQENSWLGKGPSVAEKIVAELKLLSKKNPFFDSAQTVRSMAPRGIAAPLALSIGLAGPSMAQQPPGPRESLKKVKEKEVQLRSKSPEVGTVPAITQEDKAMAPGGIDLNSANLTMTIKRDSNGVPLPFAQQDMARLNLIEGLEPVILSIKPANSIPDFANLFK